MAPPPHTTLLNHTTTINTIAWFRRFSKFSTSHFLNTSSLSHFSLTSSSSTPNYSLSLNNNNNNNNNYYYKHPILQLVTNCSCSCSSHTHKAIIHSCTKPNNKSLSIEANMTVTAAPFVKDGCLTVKGKVVLTDVPSNVVVSPVGTDGSAFLGATTATPCCRHFFTLGVLKNVKFLSLYKFKIWWMIPQVGKMGSEIPMETQMLLLEAKQESALCDENLSEPATLEDTFYILILPVLEGQFRASLLGTPSNELQFCIESGDAYVQTTNALEAVFINSGDNPFELMKTSIKMLAKHKGTFYHIDNKKAPGHLDWFGWCTWDAFYKEVSPQRIKEGLESFSAGGCAPNFLIIDDGWQDTVNEICKDGEPFIEGSQFASRLVDIKESSRFRGSGPNDSGINLKEFLKLVKENYGVKLVYMWHALVGYWGGLLPSSEKLRKYNPKIVYPSQSPGNVANLRDVAMDSLEKYGIGIIDPKKVYEFYNDLHSYLASSGVDGVKVDIQTIVETFASGFGGRVALTHLYQYALEESISKNFKDNNLICCMSHNTDSIYSSKRSASVRASEDFMPREPTFQTLHVAAVAFNSLLLGEVFVPDWDMFYSKHLTADFHAAARAIGGCAVYVSDKPGYHDFKILKRLVLPDGSVLRAKLAGRPTRDILFSDPVMDGKTLMKIWNLNKLSGVMGVFNCQGAGNWPSNQSSQEIRPLVLSGRVSPLDVEFLGEVAGENWSGECALYAFHSGSLSRLPKEGNLEVTLGTLKCEIFTISPIRVFNGSLHFAPIGLVDMYNSGGAIEDLSCSMEPSGCKIKVKVRGCGRFGAYSSTRPSHCLVDMKEEEFIYSAEDGLLTVKLEGECNIRNIEFVY